MSQTDKAPANRASYEDHDWARIREEYETTDVSTRELARRWGLRSDNSIRRRRTDEGWVRDQNAITAALVTAAVARSLGPDPAPASPDPPPRSVAPPGALMPYEAFSGPAGDLARQSEAERRQAEAAHAAAHSAAQPRTAKKRAKAIMDGATVRTGAHTPPTVASVPDLPKEPHKTVPEKTSARDAHDAAELSTARSLARIHADAIAAQVRVADRVMEVGLQLLEVVSDALSPDDEIRTKAGMILILSDKDTLHHSFDAAAKLIEKATALKRKALGMDVVKGQSGTPGGIIGGDSAGARPEKAVTEILDGLKLEELMAYRSAIADVVKLRPEIPVIDLEVEG